MHDEEHLRQRFESFYLLQGDDLFGYARSRSDSDQDALDLLQEALIKIWKWWGRNPDKTEDDLRPVMFTIIFQMAIDKARYRNRRRHVILAGDFEVDGSAGIMDNAIAEEPLPDALASNPDLAQKVREAIQRVKNAIHKRLLEIYYLSNEEPTLKQVAQELGIKPSGVNTIHRRALQSLKKSLLALAQEMNINTQKS